MLWRVRSMAYRSFRQFLDALEQAGELKRIAIPVDTELLIAEWADREMKSPGGGKALLFEQPIVDGKKSEFPVAINTMGSRRRMAMALQVSDVEDVAREVQLILKAKPPTDLREGWNLLNKESICCMRVRNQCETRPARKWCMKSIVASVFRCSICPSSNAGRKTAGVSSPCQMYIRWIRKPARAMWAFTECKCTTSARPGCIGNLTKSARATANAIMNVGSGCRSLSPWGAIRFTHSRQPHRCQTVWTNCYLRGSCEENQSSWFAAKPSTWRCRRTSTSFWKGMCSLVICVGRALWRSY